jgi:hypothetical protein
LYLFLLLITIPIYFITIICHHVYSGVNLIGYLHWTTSDNLEWKDGYCPKFGLVSVDRAANLTRTKLPSYDVYSTIVKSGVITVNQRESAWNTIQEAVKSNTTRYMCRALDGVTGLDTPYTRLVSPKDWRFTGIKPTFSTPAKETPVVKERAQLK